MFNTHIPRWINNQGQFIRALNQTQQDYVASPFFQIALILYFNAAAKNLPSAAHRLSELNRMINQFADEFEMTNETVPTV